MTGPAGGVRLTLTIGGGQDLPVEPDRYDPARAGDTTEYRTLDDGSVVQRTRPGQVTVTRPSGFQVRVVAANDPAVRTNSFHEPLLLGDVLTLDRLQALASTPGLQW